ncbi:MAG: hypothetical protein JWM38_2420 [Sphingomonas bacterium]|nr:hypothetical protein [Sphingomonas bacterium]MDB5718993.1 hypothetical protein [Sphingomonas bacterium]
MNRSLATMALLATALLAGCDGGDAEGVGGVTADEAAQLNDAAEMLDASPDGLTAPEDPALEDQGNAGDASSGGNAS